MAQGFPCVRSDQRTLGGGGEFQTDRFRKVNGIGALNCGQGTKRGQPEQSPPRQFALGHTLWLRPLGRHDDLVVRHEGLHDHLASSATLTDQSTSAHQQRHGLFCCPVAGGKQFGVKVQKCDDIDAADSMEHGFRTDIHIAVR